MFVLVLYSVSFGVCVITFVWCGLLRCSLGWVCLGCDLELRLVFCVWCLCLLFCCVFGCLIDGWLVILFC